MTDRRLSFGRAAAEYARARPGYPLQAVDWLLQGVKGSVLDLGAGTGKLTEAVLRGGHSDVIAVDPDPVMLATLEAHVPGVPTHRGAAEDIPLEDRSVGAVVVGQAWHWVHPERACKEIARVLAPGGVLGLIWNIRDETHEWVSELTRVIGHSSAETMIAAGDPPITAPFGALESTELAWHRKVTAQGVKDLVHSRSSYVTGSETFKGDLDGALERLIAGTPELKDEGEIAMPYVTHAFRARVERRP